MEKKTHIINKLGSCGGSEESSEIYTITTVFSGETEVVVSKTISKRMPIQELSEAQRIYEELNGGGGRRIITIDDLLEMQWKKH